MASYYTKGKSSKNRTDSSLILKMVRLLLPSLLILILTAESTAQTILRGTDSRFLTLRDLMVLPSTNQSGRNSNNRKSILLHQICPILVIHYHKRQSKAERNRKEERDQSIAIGNNSTDRGHRTDEQSLSIRYRSPLSAISLSVSLFLFLHLPASS